MPSNRLVLLYDVLLEAFGHRRWWPAETPWEMMIGAILTQNTNWKNVERALDNLRAEGLIDPHRLLELSEEALQEKIRPAGYFRQKAGRLRGLARWFVERFDGDIERMRAAGITQLREELLAIRGIGPETADSIVLYAAAKPTFVVDTYTARICMRHELIARDAGYDEIKDLFESALPHDTALFQDYHAQLVEVGKRFCRPTPICDGCPVPRALGAPRLEEG